MKTEKTNDAKKCQEADPLSFCGDFREMAERMHTICAGEGGAFDCRAAMMKMMGQCKGEEEGAGDAKEPREPQEGGEDR